jgi:hypothetical protein
MSTPSTLLAAIRPLVAMTYEEALEKEAHGMDAMYCLQDVLNACWDNRPDDKPGRHWSGLGPACAHCNLRAAIAAATEAEPARHEAMQAAVAYVELNTGNGCREQPPAWAVLPNGDFDAEAIAKRGRQALAG